MIGKQLQSMAWDRKSKLIILKYEDYINIVPVNLKTNTQCEQAISLFFQTLSEKELIKYNNKKAK